MDNLIMYEKIKRKEYSDVQVTFIIEGKKLNLDEFTKIMSMKPTSIRTQSDWPDAIKKNASLPLELQPRCVWELSEYSYDCERVEEPIEILISKLEGKTQVIEEINKMYSLRTSIVITIFCDEKRLPELTLSKRVISFCESIRAEIVIDIRN